MKKSQKYTLGYAFYADKPIATFFIKDANEKAVTENSENNKWKFIVDSKK